MGGKPPDTPVTNFRSPPPPNPWLKTLYLPLFSINLLYEENVDAYISEWLKWKVTAEYKNTLTTFALYLSIMVPFWEI